MADYEKGLLARVLFKRELQDVIDRRIEPKMLADEKSRKAFEFILDFYKKYGDVPSIDLVEQEFPELKLEYAKEPVGYYIDKLVEQYVRNRGSYILTENARLLVTNPMNGLETLRSEFARLTVEANPTRDVNLVETMNERKKRYLELKNLKGIDGYPTPWEVLNAATMGWHPGEFISIVSRPAVGKCIAWDSLILLPDGRQVKMQDFVQNREPEVLSLDEQTGKIVPTKVKNWIKSGRKQVYRVRTRRGRTVRVTSCHPFLTPFGWKSMDEGLSVGDQIAVLTRYNVEGKTDWAIEEVMYDEVVSIEDEGVTMTYDLEIEGTHNFIADGVVVHNTFMLVVFAEYAWANGLSVLFINNEMSAEQIGKRFDAVHFKLPYKEFRAGLLPDELEKRYFEGLQELEGENPIWVISDVSGVMSIASKIDQYKPDIVMIDGMYLLNDDRKGDSRWERVTNVSRDLKKLAQQKRVPIIATTQFNRATDETRVERVTLSNIGFSDSLGQDCLPKDTLIWSNRGIVRLDELDDEKDLVFDGETFRRFKLLKEKEKEVYEVRLKHSGQVFRCSGDHGLLVMSKKPELEWKKAKDLSPGDSVVQVESELSGERGALNYVPISKKMRFDEVESVVATGVVESMYDLNVEDSHRFVAEGLMVHNSDVVLGLFRTRDMELNNEMLVRMLKVREGQPVDFNLLWDLRRMEFKVIVTQDENQFIDDEEGDEVDF